MADDSPVIKEIFIDARPEDIFPYLTESRKYLQWMGVSAELDARPGGIFEVDPNGHDVITGEFLEVEPPHRVVFTWGWKEPGHPVPAGSTRVEIELKPERGGTLLRLTHRGLSGPIREKHEDVPVLAQHFLRVYAAKNNRQLDGFADEALGCLEAYSWPGNVRELENVVERAVVLARGSRVDTADLPDAVRERPVMLTRGGPQGLGAAAVPEGVFQIRVGTPLAEIEARLLEETLRLNHGNKTLTAKMLGIDPKTVFRKLKQGEVDDPGPGDAPASR